MERTHNCTPLMHRLSVESLILVALTGVTPIH
jgi:hypothetical protein